LVKQSNINIMHSRIVNNTRYDISRKPMKQTNFTIKKLKGETFPKSNSL